MTPAEIGYETLDPNSEMSVPPDADPRDLGAFEDVDHTGRVVEREVVERRDDAVVDHLTRAVDLAVRVARECHRRRLRAWRRSCPRRRAC